MNSINFFRQQEASFIDRFVKWMLSNGRLVVMLTYAVALAAFIYRFTIDFRITNLHNKIRADTIIVQAMSDSETTYRNLQARLKLADTINQISSIESKHLTDMVNMAKGNITYTQLSIADGDIEAVVTSDSVNNLNVYINDIGTLPYISDIEIDSINNKISTGQVKAVIGIKTLKQLGTL